jgi:hypothetical protein
MLESYQQEIMRKRAGRRVFWLAVLGLTVFLYLFFQGYYPYVRVDFANFFNERPITAPEKPQVVRAFGIINVRTSPVADRISIRQANGTERVVTNDDKVFSDFGNYSVRIEKTGYVPLSLDVILDKANSFSINVFNLLKTPTATGFSIPVDRADTLDSGGILVREKLSAASTDSALGGRVYRLLGADLSVVPGSAFRTDARPIGGGYFEKAGLILSFDPQTKALAPVKAMALTGSVTDPCFGAVDEGTYAFCPQNGIHVPLQSAGIRERFLGFGGVAVITEKTVSHVENGRLLSVENVGSGSGSLAAASVRIAGNTYVLSGATVRTVAGIDTAFSSGMLDSVASVSEFGSEAVLLGYSGSSAAFVLIDERGNRYFGKISDAKPGEIRVDNYRGAYVFVTPTSAYAYYKGSTEPIELVRNAKILGFWNGTALFEKDGKIFRLDLEMGGA